MQLRNVVLTGMAAAALITAAAPGYFGKWKMDAAKSDFGDTTFTISQTPSGEMQFSADGQTYTFKIDGKDYPAMFGGTAAWKSTDATTWEVSNKLNGRFLGTNTFKLSADGKSLTENSKGPKPAGGTYDDTATYQRMSGTAGLAGKWKTKNFKSSAPNVMEFAAAAADGMTINLSAFQAVCNVKFDGQEYPCTGPTMPPGMTVALKKSGANGFEMTEKMGGKALYQSTFTASADGKTLTENGRAVATGEKIKVVYNRQ